MVCIFHGLWAGFRSVFLSFSRLIVPWYPGHYMGAAARSLRQNELTELRGPHSTSDYPFVHLYTMVYRQTR